MINTINSRLGRARPSARAGQTGLPHPPRARCDVPPLALRRELRVAFSRRAQPVWFRVFKWGCLFAGVASFHDRRWFWGTLAGLAAAGMSLHLFYRWKTNGWTRAWGAWNDLATGRN